MCAKLILTKFDQFFPELVMSTDLLSFEHPSVLLFSLSPFCVPKIICDTWMDTDIDEITEVLQSTTSPLQPLCAWITRAPLPKINMVPFFIMKNM